MTSSDLIGGASESSMERWKRMSDERKSMVVALIAHGFTMAQIAEFSQLPVSAVELIVGGDDALGSDDICAYISERARSGAGLVERRWARAERRRRAEEMLRSGVPQAEVSRKFGMSRSWSYIIARDLGMSGDVRQRRAVERSARRSAERARRRAERESLESEVMRMLESGMKQSDVARECGRSQSWVSTVARSHGRVMRLSSVEARKRDEKVVRDAKAGVKFSELRERYGLQSQNLSRILRENGAQAQR